MEPAEERSTEGNRAPGSSDDVSSVTIDVHEHEGSLYRVLSSAIVPRAIAWVSTCNPDGTDNLAPYSFATVASVDPPVVLFAPVDGANGLKDTPRNVEATGEFVLNFVTEDLAPAMNETSATLEAGESEFDHAGLERAPSVTVDPPRVKKSPIALECTLRELHPVGGSTLVLGDVQYVHLDDSVTTGGTIDIEHVDPIGRLAGSWYARAGDRFSLDRPR